MQTSPVAGALRRIGLAAALALPAVAFAQEDAIRALLAAQAAAWNAGDAKAWTKDFAADADFINIAGSHFKGREETEQRHAQLFASIFKGSRVDVGVWKVRMLGPAAAVAETVHELRGFSRLPPGIRPTVEPGLLRTRMKYVFVKQGDAWVIVSAQNTAIAPAAPSPAPAN